MELRITKNGELYFSEVFRDERKLHPKSMEMFAKLSAQGWQRPSEKAQADR
jgi:hypothetical protein